MDDLDELARKVIDANHYMTLGTIDDDGAVRVSPVFYTPATYRRLYWLSSPEAHHSRNIAARPATSIVIFDSTAAVGQGEAVYLSASARLVGDDELQAACGEAFRVDVPGIRAFTPDELRAHPTLRLYVAEVTACEVHVPGRHPVHGRGVDARLPAHP